MGSDEIQYFMLHSYLSRPDIFPAESLSRQRSMGAAPAREKAGVGQRDRYRPPDWKYLGRRSMRRQFMLREHSQPDFRIRPIREVAEEFRRRHVRNASWHVRRQKRKRLDD